jgi:HPt (histidine-containing phosphotransfer) domain-containing protein
MRPFRDLRLRLRHLGGGSARTCKLLLTFRVRWTNLHQTMNEAKSKFALKSGCLWPVLAMIIDPRVIRASMGDDPQFIREAAADFLPGAYTDIDNISQAINATDAEGVRVGSHRLLGSAAMFGASDLKHVCTALESAARDIDWGFIRAVVPKLAASMAEVEVAIEEFWKRIR